MYRLLRPECGGRAAGELERDRNIFMRRKIFDQNTNAPGASGVRGGRVLHLGPGRHGEGGLRVGSAGQVIYSDKSDDMYIFISIVGSSECKSFHPSDPGPWAHNIMNISLHHCQSKFCSKLYGSRSKKLCRPCFGSSSLGIVLV